MIDLTLFHRHKILQQDITQGDNLVSTYCGGDESYKYDIGQVVSANGIAQAVITDRYNQNGYCYYELTYWSGRTQYTARKRQQDLTVIA